MDKEKSNQCSPREMIKSLSLHKVGKIDIVSKDRSIKLEDTMVKLFELELTLRDSSPTVEDKIRILEEMHENAFALYLLFYEQLQRAFTYKGSGIVDHIGSIESFGQMFQDLIQDYKKSPEDNKYVFYLLLAITHMFSITAMILLSKSVHGTQKDRIILAYLGTLSSQLYRDPTLPEEFALLIEKIKRSISPSEYDSLSITVVKGKSSKEGDLDIGVDPKTKGFLQWLDNTYRRSYVQTTRDIVKMRELIWEYKHNEPHTHHLNKQILTRSEEYSFIRAECIKEWSEAISTYSLDSLSEFAFPLQGKLAHMGYAEVMYPEAYTELGDFVNNTRDEYLVVLLTSQVVTEKNVTFKKNVNEARVTFSIPGAKNVFDFSKITGLMYIASGTWNTGAIHFRPLELEQQLSILDGGEEFAIELHLQVLHEIKKQLALESAKLSEVEEDFDEEVMVMDSESDENFDQDNTPENIHTSYETRLIKYENKCFETFILPEGHVPLTKVKHVLEILRSTIGIPENVSIRELHPLSKHIGWKKVAQVIEKYFECTIKKETASTHFKVTRTMGNKKFHSTLLAPQRNKYSKHAAFGTLTSMLRKLHIDEEMFWNVVHGKFTPEQMINLNKEEYYERLKNITNKQVS